MLLKIKFVVLFLAIHFISAAQSTPVKLNGVYFEIAGVGGGNSINYERRFILKDSTLRIAARVGLNIYNITDFENSFNPNLVIPFMPTLLIGQTHNAEIGIGQSFASVVKTDAGDSYRDNDLYTIFNVGYRYQKNLFLFRVGYTPILSYQGEYKNWFGMSFGVNF